MSLVFGALATDDASWSSSAAMNGTGQADIVANWYFPTTLTGGRGYWSAGITTSLRVDPGTTSNLRIIADTTLSDGVWIASPAGIVVNKWQFIATLRTNNNTGPAGDVRCWVGDILTPPVEIPITLQTSPTGTFASTIVFTQGNLGSGGSAAFQGRQGRVIRLVGPAAEPPFNLAAAGAITQAEADNVLNRIIYKIWAGLVGSMDILPNSTAGAYACEVSEFKAGINQLTRSAFATGGSRLAITVAGATVSSDEPPRRAQNPNVIWTPTLVRR